MPFERLNNADHEQNKKIANEKIMRVDNVHKMSNIVIKLVNRYKSEFGRHDIVGNIDQPGWYLLRQHIT